ETNRRRSRAEPEYELLDTGAFSESRYFDVFVEYAKASPKDILIRIRAVNRGPEAADLHLIPTLWFRNTWSSGPDTTKPALREAPGRWQTVAASHPELGDFRLGVETPGPLLFTDNETNAERLFGAPNATPFVKDAIHEFVVHGRRDVVNPGGTGTKVAALHRARIAARGTEILRVRLCNAASAGDPLARFDVIVEERRSEADDFYRDLTPSGVSEDAARVMRQAL